ncbi:MAG: T9SS type A sorting domain-containing protein [Flavipsychrobacter sp.]|nr:T9SS type A sorting domain-containing protein [Flavipsychrobacter sp.]
MKHLQDNHLKPLSRKIFSKANIRKAGLFLTFNLVLAVNTTQAITYYSKSTGALNSVGTWGTATDGSGTAPTAFNSNQDLFTIANNNTTGLTANWTVSAEVTFAATGSQTLPLNGFTLSAGQIDCTSTYTIKGSATSGLAITAHVSSSSSIYMDQTSTATATLGVLTFSGSGTGTLHNTLNIASTGTATIGTSGLTTGGFLKLKSDASGTARLAGSNIPAGTVSIERYIPGQRGYRLLGQPFNAAQNISTLGTAFDITFPGGTGNIGSCTSNVASVYSYTAGASPAFAAINAASAGTFPNATAISSHSNGVLAFIRGADGEGCNTRGTYTPSAVTAVTTGTLNAISVTEKVPANGWNLICNPLPSQVLLSAVTGASGLNAIITINPGGQNGGHTYTNGTQYVEGSTSTIIPVNGAFLAQNTTGTDITLTFAGASTTSTAPNITAFKTTSIYPSIQLSVYQGTAFWDSWRLNMQPGSSEIAHDKGDVDKFSNAQFDIYSLSSDSVDLYTDARDADSMANGDIVRLGLRSVPDTTFTLQVTDYTLPNNKIVFLHDKYTGTYTQLSNGFSYPFSITTDIASQGQNRMELVFNDVSTGVSNLSTHGMTIVPNPATNNINLSYSNAYAGSKSISIINLVGQVVKKIATAENNITILVNNLTPGLYIIKTVVNGNIITERFVKN